MRWDSGRSDQWKKSSSCPSEANQELVVYPTLLAGAGGLPLDLDLSLLHHDTSQHAEHDSPSRD